LRYGFQQAFRFGLPVALAAFACAASAASPGTRADAAPIEGTWNFSGGQVEVSSSGSGSFVGIVTQPTTFQTCIHQVGERIWEITGNGTHYTGTHLGWHAAPDGGCGERWPLPTTWDVNLQSGAPVLHECYTVPDAGYTLCFDLTQSAAPPPPALGPPCSSRPPLPVPLAPITRFRECADQPSVAADDEVALDY